MANPTTQPKVEAPAEQPDTRTALPLMLDVRHQIARRTYGMPLPLALCEAIDCHYGKDAPAKLAAAIGPSIMALLNVKMPPGALTVKLSADATGPAVWAALQSVIGAFNRLHMPTSRKPVEDKLRAKVSASTNKAILAARPEHIEQAIVKALDTYYSQKK